MGAGTEGRARPHNRNGPTQVKRNKHLPSPSIGAHNVPFVANNTVRSIGEQRALLVAVLEVGDGYLCVEYQIGLRQVVLCAVKKNHFPHFFNRTEDNLSEVTADFKSKAIERGATLEAIQLLAELTPLTAEEEAEMAKTPSAKAAAEPAANTKLSKKGAAPAAAKEPTGAKVGRVPAEFDYKVVKGAKNETREGTWSHHMIETIMAHTDTTSARAANAKAKGATLKGKSFSEMALDFAWAKEKGYINY